MCCNGFLCVINMNLFVNYIYKCCIKYCLNTNVFYFNAICCWAACYYVRVYGLMALMLLGSVAKLRWYCCRENFVYEPSQCERTLQCNIVSHWLGTHTMIPAVGWEKSTRQPFADVLTGTLTNDCSQCHLFEDWVPVWHPNFKWVALTWLDFPMTWLEGDGRVPLK